MKLDAPALVQSQLEVFDIFQDGPGREVEVQTDVTGAVVEKDSVNVQAHCDTGAVGEQDSVDTQAGDRHM